MGTYDPVPLSVATLERGETNLHSFLVNTAKKNWMGLYQLESTAFILHLTNRKMVFEPHKYHPASDWMVHIASFAATSVASSSGDVVIKNMKDKYLEGQKKSKAQQGLYFSIFWSEILRFERATNCVKIIKRQNPDDKDPLVIGVGKLTEFSKNWGGMMSAPKDFISIASSLLTS